MQTQQRVGVGGCRISYRSSGLQQETFRLHEGVHLQRLDRAHRRHVVNEQLTNKHNEYIAFSTAIPAYTIQFAPEA